MASIVGMMDPLDGSVFPAAAAAFALYIIAPDRTVARQSA
jgi:hypothetical protein